MRPPLVDTPPISHVKAQIKHTPILMCGLDWKNLTDNSIQILDSSEFMHDDSMCLNNYVSNRIKIVDTIISPTLNDARPCDDACVIKHGRDLHETLISVDSMTNQQGEFESRIIFTPTGSSTDVKTSNSADDMTHRKLEIGQQFKRSRYSDSDITVKHGRCTPHRQANVARSKSVSWAESVKQSGDYSMVKPLQLCSYETKISDVKRIPSFRSVSKPEVYQSPAKTAGQVSAEKLNESVIKTNEICSITDTRQVQPTQGNSKLKIARMVRNGLRSVKWSKDTRRKVGQTEQFYDQELKKRQLGARYSSAIGGLSDFLRKIERRKTLSDIPELPKNDVIDTNTSEPEATKEADRLQDVVDLLSDKSDEKPMKTPSLVVAHVRLASIGTSNLKSIPCQRKLSFNDDIGSSSKPTSNTEERDMNTATFDVNDSKPRRPRLGIVSSGKPVNLLPIDSLEMNIVIDLKRRIEKSGRSCRIKTNGSLKPRSLPLQTQTIGTMSPIWRKSFRHRRVTCGTKLSRTKQESLV